MKKLVTPKIGSSLYLDGRVVSGGRHFILISEADSYARNRILTGDVVVLAVGDKPVLLPDEATNAVLASIVKDYQKSKPWNPKEESYEDYQANSFIFAAEAYTSELKGEGVSSSEAELNQPEEKPLTAAQKRKLAAETAAAKQETAE